MHDKQSFIEWTRKYHMNSITEENIISAEFESKLLYESAVALSGT